MVYVEFMTEIKTFFYFLKIFKKYTKNVCNRAIIEAAARTFTRRLSIAQLHLDFIQVSYEIQFTAFVTW